MKREYHQRTIYVKQEDVQVYEEAAKMGESLSSVIVEALREYIERHGKVRNC